MPRFEECAYSSSSARTLARERRHDLRNSFTVACATSKKPFSSVTPRSLSLCLRRCESVQSCCTRPRISLGHSQPSFRATRSGRFRSIGRASRRTISWLGLDPDFSSRATLFRRTKRHVCSQRLRPRPPRTPARPQPASARVTPRRASCRAQSSTTTGRWTMRALRSRSLSPPPSTAPSCSTTPTSSLCTTPRKWTAVQSVLRALRFDWLTRANLTLRSQSAHSN
mmetsp:Transcript_7085/g.18995  ORF Transcript_7085/g.18995 Transcript_7085/m.18995 type:complete len:225 (-) Transcript_7085:1482-2156(-)